MLKIHYIPFFFIFTEGQRKANFEETEIKKHENTEKIVSLRKDIKELYVEYSKAKNVRILYLKQFQCVLIINLTFFKNDDAAERTARISRETSAIVRKRGLEEAINRINEENIRLKKTKDLLRYQSDKVIDR